MSTPTNAASTKVAQLHAQITELEATEGKYEDAQKEVSAHHKALHDYNESKDACQILFGRLAAMKGVTVKEIHEEYGMLADD